ncbi:MAG: hypothetical protein AAGI53_07115 [Planctomycetota bacterium]
MRFLASRAPSAIGLLVVASSALFVAATEARSTEPRIDYLAALNAARPPSAPSERAALLIEEANAAIRALRSAEAQAHPDDSGWIMVFPEDREQHPAGYDRLLAKSEHIVERAREAASRSRLGVQWGFATPAQTVAETPLFEVLAPHLAEIQSLRRLLALDADAALRADEPERACEDLVAIARLARLLHKDDPFGISLIVANAVLARGNLHVRQMLSAEPEFFTPDHLHRLFEAFSYVFHVRADAELLLFQDFAQRVYEPKPDGRITREGYRQIWTLTQGGPPDDEAVVETVMAFFQSPQSLSYSETIARYRSVWNRLDVVMRQPTLSEDDWREFSSSNLARPLDDPLSGFLYIDFTKLIATYYIARMSTDAMLVVLAAHLWRAEHGAFPQTLDRLTPTHLKSVPVDRFTGDPMGYIVEDGRLTVYVAGSDRDDDRGRAPSGDAHQFATVGALKSFESMPDGDWILFPVDEGD